jgi:ribonucleoside-triphosphate reductase (formate)
MQTKGYNVALSYESDFVNLMNRLQKKYPAELFEIQGIANKHLDINAFSKQFFNRNNGKTNVATLSTDPNANVCEMTVAQWAYEHGKGIMRVNGLYLTWDYITKLFSQKAANSVIELIVNGTIFVNDLHQFERPYCYGFDLIHLMLDGLKFFKGPFKIGPPKRPDSFIDLLIQSTAYISNQIAGASSYPTLFVNFDWYLRKEYGDDYNEKAKNKKDPLHYTITNLFQKLIYSWGFPFRGSQSPFVNVSILDKGFLKSLFGETPDGGNKYVNPDGTGVDLDSVYQLQKLFYEYFDGIFGKEGLFTFPITTLAISLDDENNYVDPEFVDWVSNVYPNKCLANIYIGKPNSFSSCCRMKNDFEKLEKVHKEYQNSFGVGGISIGSTRVAGINLPRIAFNMKADGATDYTPYLQEALEACSKILLAHRKVIENHIGAGALPLYNTNWINMDNQYSTFGFIGSYEFLDLLGMNVTTEEGSDYLVGLLQEINTYAEKCSEENKIPTNIEQIPGESMAVRLSEIDKLLGYNVDYEVELYSNQYIPLINNGNIFDRFKIQGKLDSLTSGGAILHLNIEDGSNITSRQMMKLLNTARETGTVYFAVNRVFSECELGHMTISNNGICKECGAPVVKQVTRVVGFFTNISSWSSARQDEFKHRVFYNTRGRRVFFAEAEPDEDSEPYYRNVSGI